MTVIQLALMFLKIGTFTFGGGMVMIAFLEQDVVNTLGWLSHREFVDAVALGQVTPGPVVISSVFIGYKVAGLIGAIVAPVAITLPSFLMTIAAAGQLDRLHTNSQLQAFLKGVSPAIVGMIVAAGVSIARTSLVDGGTVVLATACLFALVRLKINSVLVVLTAGLIGALAFR
jgi:chromate transporter